MEVGTLNVWPNTMGFMSRWWKQDKTTFVTDYNINVKFTLSSMKTELKISFQKNVPWRKTFGLKCFLSYRDSLFYSHVLCKGPPVDFWLMMLSKKGVASLYLGTIWRRIRKCWRTVLRRIYFTSVSKSALHFKINGIFVSLCTKGKMTIKVILFICNPVWIGRPSFIHIKFKFNFQNSILR